jgi:HxlR-like helix-turn-helix
MTDMGAPNARGMVWEVPAASIAHEAAQPFERSIGGQRTGRPIDMTRQRHGSESAVQIITGRWTIALLAELSERGRRYQDLHEALDGISNKVLTDTLQRAERDGL